MNPGIYASVFITFFVIFTQQHEMRKAVMIKRKKKRGLKNIMNEVIKKYIGKSCKISTGSFGTTIVGKIIDVNENWIEVETKKGNELVNAEFIQNIKINS
ncbi:hypothetical protein CACET_c14730 [Clostridium aceticum]|uniref:Preprotein translocase subunit YajC n=2 Tax=Clostridium aceticum TaxID=84022 RepID=A0A0G3WBX2_9CLOT|nr:hypothetical protein [Clostridium aceticum]AKL94934.1 hypothetical protein CACET_c14730 [Clostridium aceticum]